MTGMPTVVALRRDGLKPAAVIVDLVDQLGRLDSEQFALTASGMVSVTIPRADSLASLDFRPLVGLTVHLHDSTGDLKRHRKAAKLIAAVDPAHLVMPVWEGQELAIHQRWAGSPARTETFRA